MSPSEETAKSDAYEVYYVSQTGTIVLCYGQGNSWEEAHKSALRDVIRRLISGSFSPANPTHSESVPLPSNPSFGNVEVIYVGSNGAALCTGKGFSVIAAEKDAFANALKLLGEQSGVVQEPKKEVVTEASSSSSSSSDTLTVASATLEISKPSLPIPVPVATPSQSLDAVETQPAAAPREIKSFQKFGASTRYAVVGKAGSGKLSICLNLVSRMSSRYSKVIVLAADAKIFKRHCGLPVASFDKLAGILDEASRASARYAVIVDGTCYAGQVGSISAASSMFKQAQHSGSVDIFLTSESFLNLDLLEFAPHMLLVTHEALSSTVCAVRQAVAPTERDDKFMNKYEELVPSIGHAMAFIEHDSLPWHFSYQPWNEIAPFPSRLLA
jgi:hypothetical protein